ncbi:MAG: V-type ATPase subunit [Oscillospiraceae bacterium]|nr:V-type ATPase subunit [Oscillospiraceae bacterium]
MTDYGGLNAKIGALSGRLLGPGDYESLIGLRTVPEVVLRLVGFEGYSDLLGGIGQDGIHRGQIEGRLTSLAFRDFNGILTYITDPSLRECVSAFLLRHKVGILKYLIGSVVNGHKVTGGLAEIRAILGKDSVGDLPGLIDSADLAEFRGRLRGTRFASAMAAGAGLPTSDIQTAEAGLDVWHSMTLWKSVGKAPKESRDALAPVVGAEIDMQNIIWLYRLKASFPSAPKGYYSSLVPLGRRLRSGALVAMAETRTLRELREAVAESPYGGLLTDFDRLDRCLLTAMGGIYRDASVGHRGSAAPTVRYLFRRGLEIRNVTSIIECVRYGLGREEMLAHLIC